MADCIKYMELISSYCDNELTEEEKLKLEAHLKDCANCASIFEAFKNIALAMDETNAAVPDTLLPNIMDKITNESTEHADAKMKTFKAVNIVFSRILPIAASFTIILLIAINLFSGGRRSDSSLPVSLAEPKQNYDRDTDAEAEDFSGSTADIEATADEFNMNTVADSVENHLPFEEHKVESANYPDDKMLAPVQPNEQGEPLDAPPFFSVVTNPGPSRNGSADFGESSQIFDDLAIHGTNENVVPEEDYGDFLEHESGVGNDSQFPESISMDANASDAVSSNVSEAGLGDSGVYAYIEISGETLPGVLFGYEPVSIQETGVVLYEVSREVAIELVNEISSFEDVRITMADENGTYALVYFLSGIK